MPTQVGLDAGEQQISVANASMPPSRMLTSCGLADHYGGLSETWDNGVIYCSEQTAVLIQNMDQLRVKKELVRALPMDTPVTVDGDGLTMRLAQALHPPASSRC